MKTLSVRVVAETPNRENGETRWHYHTVSQVDMGDDAGPRHLSGLWGMSKAEAFAEARLIAESENAKFLGETRY